MQNLIKKTIVYYKPMKYVYIYRIIMMLLGFIFTIYLLIKFRFIIIFIPIGGVGYFLLKELTLLAFVYRIDLIYEDSKLKDILLTSLIYKNVSIRKEAYVAEFCFSKVKKKKIVTERCEMVVFRINDFKAFRVLDDDLNLKPYDKFYNFEKFLNLLRENKHELDIEIDEIYNKRFDKYK